MRIINIKTIVILLFISPKAEISEQRIEGLQGSTFFGAPLNKPINLSTLLLLNNMFGPNADITKIAYELPSQEDDDEKSNISEEDDSQSSERDIKEKHLSKGNTTVSFDGKVYTRGTWSLWF